MCLCKRSETWERSGWTSLSSPECDSQFGEKCLYLSVSLQYCFPSCTTASCLDYSQLWISHRSSRLPRLNCHEILLCLKDTHARPPVCQGVPASNALFSQTASCTWMVMSSLGFHWGSSRVSSSFGKARKLEVQGTFARRIPQGGGLTEHPVFQGIWLKKLAFHIWSPALFIRWHPHIHHSLLCRKSPAQTDTDQFFTGVLLFRKINWSCTRPISFLIP